MIPCKTPDELEKMRISGGMTARVLDAVAERVAPGVTTGELDAYAAELIKGMGGTAAFYGYHGYPGHLCVSVNEEVVHGIPGKRIIQQGDVVSLDVGVWFNGFIGDCATTVLVGDVPKKTRKLIQTTRQALLDGIAKAVQGNRLSDVSHAVQKRAEGDGFSVVRKFVGHGVGREMHEEPQIPNFGPPGKGPLLRAGMTLAIEPMINLGTHKVKVLNDGWTVVAADRKPSAHFEFTVAVGRDGPEVLTPHAAWSGRF
jgi:methionyl aminopeptidase